MPFDFVFAHFLVTPCTVYPFLTNRCAAPEHVLTFAFVCLLVPTQVTRQHGRPTVRTCNFHFRLVGRCWFPFKPFCTARRSGRLAGVSSRREGFWGGLGRKKTQPLNLRTLRVVNFFSKKVKRFYLVGRIQVERFSVISKKFLWSFFFTQTSFKLTCQGEKRGKSTPASGSTSQRWFHGL